MASELNSSGIYKIQSTKNPNKFYIGSSINIHNRWIQQENTFGDIKITS